MKVKSIIKCGVLAFGVGVATVSCEDMFTAENTLVSTDLAPQDTLYQMMGIIKSMQKLADRTVLLGEVRADLVDLDPLHSSVDLQELAANNVSTGNVYNRPSDYYAVINNCNVYLTYVDSTRNSQGTDKYFEKEILAAKCYRAWCYLQLLQNYGEVPFLTKPVLDSDNAKQLAAGKKESWLYILNSLIGDLKGHFRMDRNDKLSHSYGENQSFSSIRFSDMDIPVRVLLAELYLWRGSYTGNKSDYEEAIKYYHGYFTFNGEEKSVVDYTAYWGDETAQYPSNGYDSRPSVRNCAGVLPLDTATYYGTVTELRSVFCSHYVNGYYPAVSASQRMKDISKSQDYVEYSARSGVAEVLRWSHNSTYLYSTMNGDLRLYVTTDGPDNVMDNSDELRDNAGVNSMLYFNRKYGNTNASFRHLNYIPFYRVNILYLHFAEALNRAGFPETAFAILKYGLSYYTLRNRDIISQNEYDRLCELKTYGVPTPQQKLEHEFADETDELNAKRAGSVAIWSSDVFSTHSLVELGTVNPLRQWLGGTSGNHAYQTGVHSLGSGDTEYNETYCLDDQATLDALEAQIEEDEECEIWDEIEYDGDLDDEEAYEAFQAELAEIKAHNEAAEAKRQEIRETFFQDPAIVQARQKKVAELILEEEALEGVFEGLRFYDIMRYQMQEKGGAALGKTITMPECITEKYGPTPKMEGKPWYLSLPVE